MEIKLHESMINGSDSRRMVELARTRGEALAVAEITNTQIRNIFGEIKKIQVIGVLNDEGKKRVFMLPARIAYTIGRLSDKDKKGKKGEEMKNLLADIEAATSWCNASVDFEKSFGNLVSYMEAIVAYHRANEETKKKK